MWMDTPFGPVVLTFPSKQEFYAKYPFLAAGWHPEEHPGTAPLGWDLVFGNGNQDRRWLVVFCGPEKNMHGLEPVGTGAVVAFDRETEKLHVLAEKIDFSSAKERYQG